MNGFTRSLPRRLVSSAAIGLLALIMLGTHLAAVPVRVEPVLAQVPLQVSTGGPYSGTVGQLIVVTPTITGAVAPQVSWSFGDGGSSPTTIAGHAYTAPGTYVITLSVVDPTSGQTANATTSAVISMSSSCSPVALVGVMVPVGANTSGPLQVSAGGPYSGTVGSLIVMSPTISGTQQPNVSWSFGDGATASTTIVGHAYGAPGVFPITVTVTDPNSGQTVSASTTATISIAPACTPGP